MFLSKFVKVKMAAVLALSLVAVAGHAEDPGTPKGPTVADENTQLVPENPEVFVAALQKKYKEMRARFKAERKDMTQDERDNAEKQLNHMADALVTMADDAARIAGAIGGKEMIFGIIVTYGAEIVAGKNHSILAVGPSGEGGFGVFMTGSKNVLFTGVGMAGLALEASIDLNAVQNRSVPDSGWHVKFLFPGVFGTQSIVNLKSIGGWYFGLGADAAKVGSIKFYAGGCANTDEFTHDRLVEEGTIAANPKWYQEPGTMFHERVANCNTFMASLSRGTNNDAPPLVGMLKGMYLFFPASKEGRGWQLDFWRN